MLICLNCKAPIVLSNKRNRIGTKTFSVSNISNVKWEMTFPSILYHYDDVIMTMLASQITSLTVVYSIVYSGVNQRKHQSSASLAFVREIHRGPVNFPHKWPVTRKMFPFDDVIMIFVGLVHSKGKLRLGKGNMNSVTVTSQLAPWRFKSLATPPFVQSVVQVHIKRTTTKNHSSASLAFVRGIHRLLRF